MVRVKADFSDVDHFFESGMWEVQKEVIDAGDEAVRYAEDHGNYEDHTLTLRTSNKYDVDENACLTLQNDAKSGKGYPYASNVESKGYDVLSGAALHAHQKLKEVFER